MMSAREREERSDAREAFTSSRPGRMRVSGKRVSNEKDRWISKYCVLTAQQAKPTVGQIRNR